MQQCLSWRSLCKRHLARYCFRILHVRTGTEWISVALMGGFALIKENKVTILVNEAELGSNIDPEAAEAEYLAAKEALEKADGRKAKIESNLNYKRARARYQVNSRV